MDSFIVCCNCQNMVRYVQDAFSIMSKKQKCPRIYERQEIHKLIQGLRPGTNVYKFVQDLIASKAKYAFYIEYDSSGDVTEQWDLVNADRMITKGDKI